MRKQILKLSAKYEVRNAILKTDVYKASNFAYF